MKLKKFLSMLLSAAITVSSLVCGAIPASAASSYSVKGYSDGDEYCVMLKGYSMEDHNANQKKMSDLKGKVIIQLSFGDYYIKYSGTSTSYEVTCKKPNMKTYDTADIILSDDGFAFVFPAKSDFIKGCMSYSTAKVTIYGEHAGGTVLLAGKKNFSVKASWEGSSASAPKSLSCYATTKTITVSWGDTGASSYEVYRSTSKDGKYKKISVSAAAKYTDSDVKLGKTYYYKVRSIGMNNKKSGYSSVTSATVTTPPPTNIKASRKASGQAKVTWNATPEANGYAIYMATSSSGKYTKVKTYDSNAQESFIKTGLKAGKTYYFKIRSYKTINGKKVYSTYSNTVKIKV